jgi:hypothetical protein
MSERSVRNYCAQGRIEGAFLTGKTWNIPEDAEKPERAKRKSSKPETLLDILKREKDSKHHGGIYHKTQIDLTYNSKHILIISELSINKKRVKLIYQRKTLWT